MGKRKMRLRLKIRERAEAQGLDRAKLARRADVTYQTVHNMWNNSYANVSIATLEKLAQALNCDVSDLYERVDD
ncbi:MAG TPA: helix-turn-helix transcriptional regulator [Ktedonobacteraceae bacterium]|jgi:DNA-binding Xre family transcriptional regulator|nr:helix-turn-helix transcriptional regulator [Ktedonobacteraceae bacterium]